MKTIRLVSLLLLGVMFYSNVSSQERYSRTQYVPGKPQGHYG